MGFGSNQFKCQTYNQRNLIPIREKILKEKCKVHNTMLLLLRRKYFQLKSNLEDRVSFSSLSFDVKDIKLNRGSIYNFLIEMLPRDLE